MKKTKFKKRKLNRELFNKVCRTIILIGLPIIAVELILTTPGLTSSIKNAVVLATTVKPETFTELYFENHLNLPGKIELYQDYPFKFTIHNLEYKDMNYPYEVYIDLNGEKQVIEDSSVFVKSGEYKTINEDFTITLPTARAEVIVNLKDKNQQIDFWIEGI